jgi:hypothetical protein
MAQSSSDQPHNGNPTAAEIFQMFRNTTMASIGGLRLLLRECADLRGELVTIHGLQGGSDGEDGLFSARQQNRMLELLEAADDMEALLASLPSGVADAGNQA